MACELKYNNIMKIKLIPDGSRAWLVEGIPSCRVKESGGEFATFHIGIRIYRTDSISKIIDFLSGHFDYLLDIPE